MPRTFTRVSLLTSLLLTAACTQAEAPVDLKGQNSYNRNGNESLTPNYASNTGGYHTGASAYNPAPVYTNNAAYNAPAPARNVSQSTEQSAGVQSIGVSDLAPPAKSDKGAMNLSNPPAAHPASMAVDGGSGVNPWNHKAHFSDTASADDESFALRPGVKPTAKEPMVSDVQHPQVQASGPTVAQLDVIGNDGGVKAPAKAIKTASSGFMWPVAAHKVISGFGPKGGGKVNDGINIASAEGEPVWAAADGEVVYVGNELQGYGNMVIIKHAGSKTTTYAHLARANVDKYGRVKQGDIIGYVGSTGNVSEPQLHFAIRDGKEPVDPQKYLSRNVASN